MAHTPEDLAGAFSGHRFEEVVPFLSDTIEWDLVGDDTLVGREAVVERCRATAEELADVRTDFRRFLVVAGRDVVAVDSVAEYTGVDGDQSVVASCDLYEFEEGIIVRIRSYNIELD